MQRILAGLRWVPNWWQLGRFLTVGASGFAINLIVYGFLVHAVDVQYVVAAVISNFVALTSNFFFNRHWTFEATHGRRVLQAPRFAAVSIAGFIVNLLVLRLAVEVIGIAKLPAEGIASAIAAPVNFLGSRQWAFRLRGARAPEA
jgi:dolichol-phosphate mannosyltransferase